MSELDVTLRQTVFCAPPANLETAVPAMPAGHEVISPFVARDHDADALLQALVAAEHDQVSSSLPVALLRDTAAIIDRLLDAQRLATTVLAALALIALGSSFASYLMLSSWMGARMALHAALAVPLAALASVAATAGPIHAVSIQYGVRIPLARLIAVQLCATATGVLVLAALSPLPQLLWQLDVEWVGPLSMVAVFVVAGFTIGARMRVLLLELGDAVTRAGSEAVDGMNHSQSSRVRVLARVALLLMSFAFVVSTWSWFGVL
ncbi:MAG: hypothetical protein ABIJ09_11185 [Pseudomonadota bacterium]